MQYEIFIYGLWRLKLDFIGRAWGEIFGQGALYTCRVDCKGNSLQGSLQALRGQMSILVYVSNGFQNKVLG